MIGTGTEMAAVSDEIRERLAISLDTDDLVAANRLAQAMRPYFGVAKIGLELFSAAGPDAIGSMRELGYQVFLDLKLYDIPTTVNRAATVLGALGVDYLTLHAHGGVDMLAAGVQGLRHGAEQAGLDVPIALAVTVLTSDDSAPPHIVPNRVRVAVESGCGGLILAAADLQTARELAPRLRRVVPGIRLAGDPVHDQARSATPKFAAAQGADLLVIGRAVTQASDPVAAAAAIASAISD
jgi:orotidine-5'-phosphate decarboxylase